MESTKSLKISITKIPDNCNDPSYPVGKSIMLKYEDKSRHIIGRAKKSLKASVPLVLEFKE